MRDSKKKSILQHFLKIPTPPQYSSAQLSASFYVWVLWLKRLEAPQLVSVFLHSQYSTAVMRCFSVARRYLDPLGCSGRFVKDAGEATGVSRASVSRAVYWTLSRKEVLHPPGKLNEAWSMRIIQIQHYTPPFKNLHNSHCKLHRNCMKSTGRSWGTSGRRGTSLL